MPWHEPHKPQTMNIQDVSNLVAIQQSCPRKLKATCDFCAISKVKCDRGKPHCSRCKDNGVLCHYSESRRMGRARQMPQASSVYTSASSSAQPTPAQCSVDMLPSLGTSLDQFNLDTAINDGYFSLQHTPLPLDVNWPPNLRDDFMADVEVGSNTHSVSSIASSPPSNPSAFMTLGSTCKLQPISRQDSGIDVLSAIDLPKLNKTGNCMARACSTLEALTTALDACTYNPSPDRSHSCETRCTGLDGALRANRAAVAVLHHILSCSCSRDPGLVFLLILIANKAFETLAQTFNTSQKMSSDTDRQSCLSNNPETAALDFPLYIGEYMLDCKRRNRVIVQVMEDELDDLRSVVDKLSILGFGEGPLEDSRRSMLEAVKKNIDVMLHSLQAP